MDAILWIIIIGVILVVVSGSIYYRVYFWGQRKGVEKIAKTIHKAVKEKRIRFVGEKRVEYRDKAGKRRTYNSYLSLASKLIDAGGWAKQMVNLHLTIEDVVAVLVEEHEKQIKEETNG